MRWPIGTPIKYGELRGTITDANGDQRRVSWDETSCAPGDAGSTQWLSLARLYAHARVPIIQTTP